MNLAWVMLLYFVLMVIAEVRARLYFRCPTCGRTPQEGWMTVAVLPVGLVLPGLLLPIVGPIIVLAIVALDPKCLLDFTTTCPRCTLEYNSAYTGSDAIGAPTAEEVEHFLPGAIARTRLK